MLFKATMNVLGSPPWWHGYQECGFVVFCKGRCLCKHEHAREKTLYIKARSVMSHTYSLDLVDSYEYGLRFSRLRATSVNHRAPSLGLFVEVNCVLCFAMVRGKEANNGAYCHFLKYIKSSGSTQVAHITRILGYSPRTMAGRMAGSRNEVQKYIHC